MDGPAAGEVISSTKRECSLALQASPITYGASLAEIRNDT
jgi:hypothetical protein